MSKPILRRKIEQWLIDWKSRPKHKPALIKGIRQSGKTYSIQKFAKENYESVIYFNFMVEPGLCGLFDGDLVVDKLLPLIASAFPESQFVPGKTVFIFDEVQDCPRARLSQKSFFEDGRFDVISSGSYLGIKGYVVGDDTPIPVGYEEIYDMHTLDFEEFLWALGHNEASLEPLKKSFFGKTPLNESLKAQFESLFRYYLCVGGFPEAVVRFVETKNPIQANRKTRELVEQLKSDFGRRKGRDGKPLFLPNEVARIQAAFSLIPSFLAKENKRYVVSKIGSKHDPEARKDAIQYLCDAGIAVKSKNVTIPSVPLSTNVIDGQFKLFVTDIGLLSALLEEGALPAIVSGDLGMAKGAIYEGLVADALHKNGFPLFYFAKDTGLEIDFVEAVDGVATLFEVKAESGNAKSAKTVLKHPEHYGVTRLFKMTGGNVGEAENMFTFPWFMMFLISPTKD